jgi:hypothetical protein
MASCVVSYSDLDGLRHSVQLDADSLYEAAVKAIVVFRKHGCEPGSLSNLEIEVRSSVTHTLLTRRVHEWLEKGAHTPKEAATKARLRELLSEL